MLAASLAKVRGAVDRRREAEVEQAHGPLGGQPGQARARGGLVCRVRDPPA
jgi:hypothetical protein